eukprot:4474799-Alexandrium_andersonii.AAC.1
MAIHIDAIPRTCGVRECRMRGFALTRVADGAAAPVFFAAATSPRAPWLGHLPWPPANANGGKAHPAPGQR